MVEEKNIEVEKVAYHRNGVGGVPFFVVKFKDLEQNANMVGIVFDEPYCVAVFNYDLFSEGEIEFGKNSWRGDVYEPCLRKAIKEKI